LTQEDLIQTWSTLLGDTRDCWVVFEHGTCVVLVQPEADIHAQAVALLRQWGPVHAGSPAGDFSVVRLDDVPGVVVTCHHRDILTYVEEDSDARAGDFAVGLLGRSRRDDDARALNVIHVEDRRSTTV
jgi:hypothetical protein